MRRIVLLACGSAMAAAVPAVVQSQPRPGPRDPLGALRDAGGARTRIVRDAHGRPRMAYGMRAQVAGAAPRERAARLLARHGAAFGLDGLDLRFEHERRAHGLTTVRFRRHVHGRPVVGRTVTVRMHGGFVDTVLADVGSLQVDWGTPSVGATRAAREAERHSDRWGWAARRAVDTRPVAFDTGHAIVAAWQVEVEGTGLHHRVHVWIDARDGSVLLAARLVRHALGRIYDSNPVVAMEETTEVELANLTSRQRLTGRNVRVSACGTSGSECAPAQRAEADDDGNFLFEPEEPSFDDAFSEVSAYFHADRAARYFQDGHDYVWRCCGDSKAMEVIANFVQAPEVPFANAAYSPTRCSRELCGTMVLGQGADRDFAYDGEVIYHEFAHGVIDETAALRGFEVDPRLGVGYGPSAVNEGLADYFSGTISGDPLIAEYLAGSSSLTDEGALRQIDNDLRCPQDLFGEGHQDGRLVGGVLWAIREAVGAEGADALAYATLGALGTTPKLRDFAALLHATAMALADEDRLEAAAVAIVEDAIEARGLFDCDRIVPLDDGAVRTGYSGDAVATGREGEALAPLHYSLQVPADAERVVVQLQRVTPAGRYTLLLRNGEPVRFFPDRRPAVVADTELEDAARVELTAGGAHPLRRCETLFLALRTEDLASDGHSIYRLGIEVERRAEPLPCADELDDAGVDGGADAGAPTDAGGDGASGGRDAGADAAPGAAFVPGGGGCGCRLPPHRGDAAGGVLAAAVLLLLARRRSQSSSPSVGAGRSAKSIRRRGMSK